MRSRSGAQFQLDETGQNYNQLHSQSNSSNTPSSNSSYNNMNNLSREKSVDYIHSQNNQGGKRFAFQHHKSDSKDLSQDLYSGSNSPSRSSHAIGSPSADDYTYKLFQYGDQPHQTIVFKYDIQNKSLQALACNKESKGNNIQCTIEHEPNKIPTILEDLKDIIFPQRKDNTQENEGNKKLINIFKSIDLQSKPKQLLFYSCLASQVASKMNNANINELSMTPEDIDSFGTGSLWKIGGHVFGKDQTTQIEKQLIYTIKDNTTDVKKVYTRIIKYRRIVAVGMQDKLLTTNKQQLILAASKNLNIEAFSPAYTNNTNTLSIVGEVAGEYNESILVPAKASANNRNANVPSNVDEQIVAVEITDQEGFNQESANNEGTVEIATEEITNQDLQLIKKSIF
jgi:hypothetical protein